MSKRKKAFGWFTKLDAGNVPVNNAIFNSGIGAQGTGQAMGEEVDPESIEEKDIIEELKKEYAEDNGLYTEEERVALKEEGFIQNLTDNEINTSKKLDLAGLHRSYPLNDSVLKILLKIQYRVIRYN